MCIFLGTNLTMSRGTEVAALQMAKNVPKDVFELTIVQTDYLPWKPMTNVNNIQKYLNGVKLITAKSVQKNSRFFRVINKIRYSNKYFAWLLGPVTGTIGRLYWLRTNRRIVNEINNSDIIYIVDNNLIRFIKPQKRSLVIGSTQQKKLDNRFRFIRLRYRRFDGFHFLTESMRDAAIIHRRFDFVLPNGVDTKIFKPALKANKRPIRILFVSAIEKSKGITKLFDVWDMLQKENLELHIVGRGSMEDFVKKRIHKNVVYHGALTGKKLASIYRNCDIFVYPTSGETFGIVAIEALASGNFVVASDVLYGVFNEFERLGMLEYVRNEPQYIKESILKAMNLVRDKNFNKIRRRAYAIIKQKYDWDRIAKTLFVKLYKSYEEKNGGL